MIINESWDRLLLIYPNNSDSLICIRRKVFFPNEAAHAGFRTRDCYQHIFIL